MNCGDVVSNWREFANIELISHKFEFYTDVAYAVFSISQNYTEKIHSVVKTMNGVKVNI